MARQGTEFFVQRRE